MKGIPIDPNLLVEVENAMTESWQGREEGPDMLWDLNCLFYAGKRKST